jgi:transcriptional regulator with XRE-family HTH domain/tetratricopeptide (TPR) repeat protein
MTGPGTSFGVELRRRRSAAGVSLAQLAERVHYSKGYLSRIESGVKPPTADVARCCDAALEADGALAALVPPARPRSGGRPDGDAAPVDDAVPVDEEGQVWDMQLAADGSFRLTLLSRRQALAAGGGSLLGAMVATPGPRASAAAARQPLDAYVSVFGHLRRLGQTTSPAVVLPLVVAQVGALRGLAAAAGGRRDKILLLAARHAEFVGWLAQECDDARSALWWTDKAVEMADATGDREMAANALVRRALIAMYREDAVQTIALARRAQDVRMISPRIRGLAALQEAQGHALAGDRSSCERSLDQGTELMHAADAETASELTLGSTYTPDLAEAIRGWCYHDLGRSSAAAEILDPQLALIPRSSGRTFARFGARLALSHAAAGDVDSACRLASDVVDAAEAVDSATVRTDLGRLARTLARWPTKPVVREVRVRLAEALTSPAF